MAQYNGFVCDSCGNIIEEDDRTRIITRYEGKVISGENTRDLCGDCVVAPEIELKPLRRRRGKNKPKGAAVEGADAAVGDADKEAVEETAA